MSLNELYKGCRTYRRFLQEPVPDDILKEILDNARQRSCGRNAQILKFYAVTSAEKLSAFQSMVKWAGALPPEIGTPKSGELPVAFIVITKPAGEAGFSDVDVGIAADTICASAWEYGFGSCMMGAINVKAINELLGLGANESTRLAIALGKPAHTSTIVDVPESGKLSYYVDEDRNYYVPKRSFDEVVSVL